MESSSVWNNDDLKGALNDSNNTAASDILPAIASSLSGALGSSQNSNNDGENEDKSVEIADDFYKNSLSYIKDPDSDDLLMDQLKLHSTTAKLSSTVITDQDLNVDDTIYKSSTINGSGADPVLSESATMMANVAGEKIFQYDSFADSKSYIKFSYKDIPDFLDLIFEKVNSETSSNKKNSIVPAVIVFQMLRYSFYKKQNLNLTNNFFDLFINRIYLIIEDDTGKTSQGHGSTKEENEAFEPSSKKHLIKTKVKKKNDIVLIAYWISVINYLYYYFLRQNDFFRRNPSFLRKISVVLNDLLNEFLNGIVNRLADIIDECIIHYASIPSLQKGLLFQNDWNFFKKDNASTTSNASKSDNANTFQEVLDNLYPPNIQDQMKPSPIKFLQVLEAIIYVFRLYNINSIILKNLLARVFSWINSTAFNKIILNKKRLFSRTSAIQLRLNMSIIEDWVRSISKNLAQEDLELNDGKTNEEYFLGEDHLSEILKDYPDDLINFKYDWPNVSRFRKNSRFYDAEKEAAVKAAAKRKKQELLEAARRKKEEAQKKTKEGESEDEEDDKKDEFNGEKKEDDKFVKKDEQKQENGVAEIKLKTVDPEPMLNLSDDADDDGVAEGAEDIKGNSFKKMKLNINDTPVRYFSDFYYKSLYSIFKDEFRVLYNLLEFLQVGTTCFESLLKSVEAANEKSSKSSKQIEEEVDNKYFEFLKQDIMYLNFKQIHHVCKNYRYELDETKFGKKLLKSLSKLGKSLSTEASYLISDNKNLRFISYAAPQTTVGGGSSRNSTVVVGAGEDLLFLNQTAGRDYPVCMPTRHELISRFGAGLLGNNKENLLRYQPYVSVEVRDAIDTIHDQMDYKEFGDEEDNDEEDDDGFGEDDRGLNHEGLSEQFTRKFGAADDEDFYGMTKPESTVAKTWELNDHSTKAKTKTEIDNNDNFEYNPW